MIAPKYSDPDGKPAENGTLFPDDPADWLHAPSLKQAGSAVYVLCQYLSLCTSYMIFHILLYARTRQDSLTEFLKLS
ncbi:MAG: hypothetical protein GDA36_12200 [Rhodobacteraceae bacterium]|nr:hypothetical protein [Paracoccaceae bacterium]